MFNLKLINGMKKYLIIVVICLQFCIAINAQEKSALNFTRKTAVEFALRNNPELKAVKEGINAARGRASQTGRLSNPVLGSEYGNDTLFSAEGEYAFRVSISQKFPLFGRLSKEKKIGSIDIKLASVEYEEARRLLALQVEKAYLDALEMEAIVAEKRNLLTATQKLESTLKNAAINAEVSNLEAKRAESESAKLKVEIMRDDIEAAVLKTQLKTLLGISPESEIRLLDKLSEISIPDEKFSMKILEARPDWQMYSIAEQSANASIALLKAGRFEDIEVGVFFEASESVDEPVGMTREKIMGLSVSIPLPFNSNDGGIEEQFALRRQAKARAAAKENQIKAEISIYRMRAQKYMEILNNHRSKVVALSDEIYEEYLKARKEAQAGISDVFSAWQTNLQLKLNEISITAEQARNSISLRYALALENKDEK